MNIFHALLPSQHQLLHVTMLILLPNCAVHHHCRRHAVRQMEVQNDPGVMLDLTVTHS
jgi:hypothetical protein